MDGQQGNFGGQGMNPADQQRLLQQMMQQRTAGNSMQQQQQQQQMQPQQQQMQQQQQQANPQLQGLPIRAYLDQTVVPILLDGEFVLCRRRILLVPPFVRFDSVTFCSFSISHLLPILYINFLFRHVGIGKGTPCQSYRILGCVFAS